MLLEVLQLLVTYTVKYSQNLQTPNVNGYYLKTDSQICKWQLVNPLIMGFSKTVPTRIGLKGGLGQYQRCQVRVLLWQEIFTDHLLE